MTLYVVDNSVLQRLPRSTAIQRRLAELSDAEHEFCSCLMTVDEFGYSTRSWSEYREAERRMRRTFRYLPMNSLVDEFVVEIRAALWQAGKGRAAGVIDVAIAATAVAHGAAVLHYDRDFEHIASTFPQFTSEWAVAPGTVD